MHTTIRKYLLPAVLIVALVAAVCWAVYERRRQETYRTNLESMYERSFFELVDSVGNMEVQLSKLLITETPEISLNLLSDISHKADGAQAAFSLLPARNTEGTAKFVNQIGDYCQSLSQRVAQGQPLSSEQRDQLLTLRDRLTTLGNQMRDVQAQTISGGESLWSAAFLTAGEDPPAVAPLDELNHTGVDYPSLVYDGPFSDARDNPPKGLSGAWVDYAEAERLARAFVGESRVEWTMPSSDGAGDIPTFGVEMMLSRDGVVTVQVTKQGGHILWMVSERIPDGATYDINQCYDAALAFMAARGYPEVTLSYYQAYDGVAVFNLIPVEEGVLLYPDLIKLQISMQTCQIIGIEAGNYLRNHAPRELPSVKVTLEEALLLATRLDVVKTQLALIPKLSREILCHEITGTFLGDNYILYVDAETGKEIDLFKILDTDGGQLAM